MQVSIAVIERRIPDRPGIYDGRSYERSADGCGRRYSARAARELAEKYEVEMPIITEVNRVLFEGKSAAEAVMDLMLRDKKVETPMLPWENA